MISMALSGLQTVINQYLSLAHNRDELLAPLSGKVVAVHLQGLGQTIYFFLSRQKMELLREFPGTPDAEIRGTLWSLAAMKFSKQRRGLLTGDVTIDGNMQVAQQFNDLMDQLDIDWEEHLAKLTGDSIAHTLGNMIRQTCRWGKKTRETLTLNVSEYVQHEISCFPSRIETDDFLNDVDELRSDVDRLSLRIKQLTEGETQ
jgi:ubiquinone biosynthesis protein UbiJ